MGGDYVLIGWLALDTTQSSSWVGIAFALYYLPNIIFGIIGGGIADRFPRRGLLQGLDSVSYTNLTLPTTTYV